MMTEENMFEYMDSLLHDLPKYCSDLLLPLMSEYKILRQVCRHLRDFYELECNKITTTEFLYARYQMTVDRVTQFCFDLWTGKYKNYTFFDMYAIYRCSSEITFLLIDIIPLELEVLYICTSKLIKESRSKELERCVKQILKASPRILQNYLILLQQGMAGALAVNYAPTQTINVMMEFLLIFLTDIPKRFIHHEKLNDMLAHVGVLTRKITILVTKMLEESSENNINEADFSASDFLQEIEQMKGDIRQIFLKSPGSSQLCFPMNDGFLYMNLLLRHLNESSTQTFKIPGVISSFVEVTVGHEEEEARIICQLLDEHESELDVISIVGMPGLGKTTLANKVYKNTLVATHFNVRAWCTVSQKYNKSKVLREILQQVTVSEKKESEDDLAENLRRALLDKRYLIVLDDVWDIETGEMLIACFPKVKRGNRIILTSRSSKVGLQVKCHSDPLHLQLLTPEKSWDLFVKKVFGDEGSCPAELSEVGHQIVEKCKGLPLAIVLIAGVIVRGKKKEKDLWFQIEHNLDSFISSNNNLQMMKVMQLSYDHLPCHLKPLLLYFARSQKSKRTPVSTLMQLWMAEGLVDHDSLEEATQSHLDSLISSSLIMVDHIPSESIWWTSVMIKVCYMHDVVHDFCSVKVKKEKFFKLINSGARLHVSDFLHHRLTIHTVDSQVHKRCVLFNSNKCSAGSKHLISLTVSGWLDESRYICYTRHMRLVRVLQLDDIVLGEALTEEIGSLFHLRFLSIWAYMKAIPVSWVNLQNLETLLINTEYTIITMVLLPRILKLSKLNHVSIDQSSFFEEEDADQSRILEGENSKLTTLSHVDISYSEGTNDALKKFPNLQHLECTIRIPEDPLTHGNCFPKFDVLNKLESLFIEYHNRWNDYVYPNEYHFPTSLKELRLYNFLVRPALLSAIAELSQLEILEFIESNFVEDKWDASEDMYQSLKTLSLREVNLSEWEVDKETFPKLEELILDNFYKLTEIPSVFGDIDTLKSVQVVQSKREVGDSAMEIKKDVAAYTGEDRLHVHIS